MTESQEQPRPSHHWRQGDILPDSLAQTILSRIDQDEHYSSLRSFRQPGVLVLLNQDCDLVSGSMAKMGEDPWSRDPFAEAIWGSSNPDIKQPDQNSPRSIRLPLTTSASGDFYVFEDRNRIVFPREWLAEHAAFTQKMRPDPLRKLVRLIMRRYDREPLPTAFVNRMKKKGVAGKVEKLLRTSQEQLRGVAIYLYLDTRVELSNDPITKPYRAFPVAVCQTDKNPATEQARRNQADEIMNGKDDEKDKDSWNALGLIRLLEKCDGIEVIPDTDPLIPATFRQTGHVITERQYTLDHRYDFKPWEFDHLSPHKADVVPLSPHSN